MTVSVCYGALCVTISVFHGALYITVSVCHGALCVTISVFHGALYITVSVCHGALCVTISVFHGALYITVSVCHGALGEETAAKDAFAQVPKLVRKKNNQIEAFALKRVRNKSYFV